MIEEVIGPVRAEGKSPDEEAPRAPGMKYMHYAPESPLFVIEPDEAVIREAVHADSRRREEGCGHRSRRIRLLRRRIGIFRSVPVMTTKRWRRIYMGRSDNAI